MRQGNNEFSLGSAIRAAKDERDKSKPENQNATIPEDQKTIIPVSQQDESWVNLAIRVTKRQRVHWLIESKKQGTSLTAAIVEALNARFGSPVDE